VNCVDLFQTSNFSCKGDGSLIIEFVTVFLTMAVMKGFTFTDAILVLLLVGRFVLRPCQHNSSYVDGGSQRMVFSGGNPSKY